LTSVHAFATDPTRGVYILMLLIVAIGGSLLLFAARAPALKAGGVFAPVSREASLVINNLLLAVATAAVFAGTLWPLFAELLLGQTLTVGAPYFNIVFPALMAPLVLVMAIGPLLPWKRADLAGALQRLWVAAAAAIAGVLLTVWLEGGPWTALV